MSSKKIIGYATALLVVIIIYFGRAAYRAHLNLVTLDVRDMDVRDVVSKMEHQTWEVIFVDKTVSGKITMQVENMPLEEALRLVGSQALARAATIYPLYSTSDSFKALKQSLRGEVDPATHGWTNLSNRAMAMGGMGGGPGARGGMGGMMMGGAAQNQLVSLSISAKDVAFASMALNRFASARVVPEDGVNATVSFIVKQATVPETVARLAKAAGRKWTTLYALQGFGGPGGPGGPGERGGFAGFGGGGPGGPPPAGGNDTNNPPRRGGFGGFGDPNMTDEQRAEARRQREALDQELLATLPQDERQKIEEAQAERDKLMQEMANMTDEQRRDRMMQMMGPGIDKMARERLLNSTPEQRARMRGPGGGPGTPGRNGPGR